MKSLGFEPIGVLRSCFKERFGTPRQGLLTPNSRAYVALRSDLKSSLDGLEEFSHVWLVSFLHLSEPVSRTKIHPPRRAFEKMGVFATRSPHRPNPIGLTLASILKIEEDGLWVSGMDLIEGTPILDIKPYVSRYDSTDSKNPSWIDDEVNFEVKPSEEFLNDLKNLDLPDGISATQLLSVIQDSIQQDPRPKAYKNRPQEKYFMLIYNYEVGFAFEHEIFTLISISLSRVSDLNAPNLASTER